jgi:predicted acyltransferase
MLYSFGIKLIAIVALVIAVQAKTETELEQPTKLLGGNTLYF